VAQPKISGDGSERAEWIGVDAEGNVAMPFKVQAGKRIGRCEE